MQFLRIETAQPTPTFGRTWSSVPQTPSDASFNIDPSDIRLIQPVGEGSSGIVFKARYNGAIVAAKLLPGGDSLAFEQRLLRHPNLVSIYGKSSHPSGPVLIMEYISGGNLRDWMSSHVVPSSTDGLSGTLSRRLHAALSLSTQIASGMACLHASRIVHRDLKPENVLLQFLGGDEEPQVKIADFGLSRDMDLESGNAMTSTNGVKGTPTYMSPEQWRRGSVTDKADVYAFGLILLELFSGEEVQWLDCPPQFATQAGREAARSKFYKWLRKGAKAYVPPVSATFPAVIRDLVCSCMSCKPEERPTFTTIVKLLNGVDLSAHVASATMQLTVPETVDDVIAVETSPVDAPELPTVSIPFVVQSPQQRLSPPPRHRKPIRRSPTHLRKVSTSPSTITECSVADELPHTPVDLTHEPVSVASVDANPAPFKPTFLHPSLQRQLSVR